MQKSIYKHVHKLIYLSIVVLTISSCATKPPVVIRKPTNTVDKPIIVNNDKPKPSDPEDAYKPTPKEEKVEGGTNTIVPATLTIQLSQVLQTADSYTGTKHRLGGLSKKGIDCSGLVQVAYNSIDVKLPRSTRDQVNTGSAVKRKDLRKGDLVFFTYPGGKRITHVGIVYEIKNSGEVIFIHTSTSRGVRKDSLSSGYWKPLLVKSRRVLE